MDLQFHAPICCAAKPISTVFLYERQYYCNLLYGTELRTTKEGKTACPTCKKTLKFSEQMQTDHETVCVFCGTVLSEDAQPASPVENSTESRMDLSINLVGNYQKLFPREMKSSLSNLRRFYINRPDLSTFATVCQWLELPTHVSQEAWILYKKTSSLKKCFKADAALFALMRSCQRHSIPRTEAKISHYVRKEMGRKRVRSYAKICLDLKPLIKDNQLGLDPDTLNYYLNLHFKTLCKKYPRIDITKIRIMVKQKLDADCHIANKDTRVKKAIKFVMGGLYA